MTERETGDYRPGVDDTDTLVDAAVEAPEEPEVPASDTGAEAEDKTEDSSEKEKDSFLKSKAKEIEYLNGHVITHRVFTLPNFLTLLRLLLLVPFVWLYCIEKMPLLAFLFLLLCCVTDALDGFVARRNESISYLGMTLDPIVDRLVIATSVICVYIMGSVPLWVLVVLILRDLILLVMHVRMRIEKREFRVALIGKVTTASLMIGFVSLVVSWPSIPGLKLFESSLLPGFGAAAAPVGIWFIYIGVVLSLISGIYYLKKYGKRD